MLDPILESLDGLHAEIAKEYKQATEGPFAGKFVLDVKAGGPLALEDVSGLKRTIQTLRGEKLAIENKAKAFDGLDPTKAREAVETVERWGSMDPEAKAAELLKSKETQLQAKFKLQEDALVKERDGAVKQLDQHIRVSALTSKFASKKPVDGGIDFLMPHALAQTRTRKGDNGTFVTEVIDADGNVRISPSGSGTEQMTLDQLVSEFVTKFPFAFEGSGATGSGATGGGAGGTSKPPVGAGGSVKTISRTDQDSINRNLDGIAKGTIKVV